ncbi:hypothetical protein OHA98_28015 [Streptomyces sp. NBC_00654]|uniref:hypothetical protein n=1 Tax=Streptomyces sp. NBC_00654 TaxID=2975799 RepID=UPI00224E64F2|nr:hypothetical protein [Streptomyces sp. NBC_00654]MCX4968533.1 hypothetical protein [Streptomyces sp. NBC_00654]
MPARTPTSSRPPATTGVEVRLPWWAVALPAVAFAALLMLIVNPGQAQAASGDPAIGQLIERLISVLSR